jgi:hypothetical protein
MPATRRSTGSGSGSKASSASNKKSTQTKLAFHSSTGNRISKRGLADSIIDKKDKGSQEHATEPSVVEVKHGPEPVVDLTLDYGLDDENVETVDDDDELQLQKEAKKVSTAQMNKYWIAKENLMKAPRAHFEKLSVSEKILREWDVDGRYGVSTSLMTIAVAC